MSTEKFSPYNDGIGSPSGSTEIALTPFEESSEQD